MSDPYVVTVNVRA